MRTEQEAPTSIVFFSRAYKVFNITNFFANKLNFMH